MPPVGYRICNTYHSFSAPIPPTPFPSGEGGDLGLFYARGFAPCIPGAEPGRHLQNLPSRFPEWGFAPCEAEFGRHSGARRGRSGFGRLPTLPLAYFPAPIPPTPLPGGKGEDKGFFMQGASPLASPGLNPGGTYRTCQADSRSGALPLAKQSLGGIPVPGGGVAVRTRYW